MRFRRREPEVGDTVTREPASCRADTGWRKSSRSQFNNCVEVCFVGDDVPLRNSRDPDGPVLVFTAPEWDAFVEGVKRGEFDRPR
jgi:hypothetical protein